MESLDPEKKTVTFRISDCLTSDCYKTVIAPITVTPKEDGDGSRVIWTVVFEKIRHGIDDHQHSYQLPLGD
ncbi:hypothetical protein EUTSA_v10009521mg [Eutrema salsugineum]|uniref:Bet v I/Major latex protein domain-containing protein n=1 Tax=Eutrema salsugineum TaxID=72664 RepID=V4K9L2_EUTSA|nr:hypothetical protein EUTSA_v10009521mg [Eutrema salsugineum]